MRILITGITGYVGGALTPRLVAAGHDVRGFSRDASRCPAQVACVEGDAVTGAGLDEALEGVDVAYFLIHSMERTNGGEPFSTLEARAARNVAEAAKRAGVQRIVYLGGTVPQEADGISAHLASRLAVEEILLGEIPDSVALRASIVIGAGSRSFRFLVRLVERLPVVPLPPWARYRSRPIDGRDVVAYLERAASEPAVAGCSLDISGPDELAYGEMIERIRDLMLVGRPTVRLGLAAGALAAPVAAAVAGEDPGLVGPLMGSLTSDLLPRDERVQELMPVRLHRFDRAVERALRDWEAAEPGSVAAR